MNVFGIETISRMTFYKDVTCIRGWAKKGRRKIPRKISAREKSVMLAIEICKITVCERIGGFGEISRENVDIRNVMTGAAQKRERINENQNDIQDTALARLNRIITSEDGISKAKIAKISGMTFRGVNNVLDFLYSIGVVNVPKRGTDGRYRGLKCGECWWSIDYKKMTDEDLLSEYKNVDRCASVRNKDEKSGDTEFDFIFD